VPGVQVAGVPVAVQLPPMGVVVVAVQFVPLQQTGGIVEVLQVRPGAQVPIESQTQPSWPATQVVAAPGPLVAVPPPHMLGTPLPAVSPQPQHCGGVQVPH
jgi:hypothetical protein